MNAVIYARYSSHSQKDASIEQQIRVCRHYASENGLQVVGEYADRALTGTTDRRPDFLRMIRDSEKGRWQVVLVYKVDRFARNRYDSATYKAKLKKHGVRVISAMEPIPDTPEGILLESLLEGSAEYYSANLSQNIRRGMQDNALNCRVNCTLPLGYKKGADGRFEIDPAGADVVREIFARYAGGEPTVQIIDDLNARGIRTSIGKDWNKNSLRKILQNERYLGVYKWGDVRIEGGVPAIVSREVFEKVQEKKKKIADKPARGRAKADYLLVGKLFCGICRSPMVGDCGYGRHGDLYHYYACARRKKGEDCTKKAVKKEWIEELVVRATRERCLTDEVIGIVADQVLLRQEEERQQSRLPSLEKELADVQKQLSNAADAILAGYTSETLKGKIEALEARKATLENVIQTEQIGSPQFTRDIIVNWLRGFRSQGKDDPELCQTLIRVFVKAVYLYDDHLDIVYGFDPDDPGEPGPDFEPDDSGGVEVFEFDAPESTRKRQQTLTESPLPFFLYKKPSYFYKERTAFSDCLRDIVIP